MMRHVEKDTKYRIHYDVYRCGHCSALQVNPEYHDAPKKCAKCKL